MHSLKSLVFYLGRQKLRTGLTVLSIAVSVFAVAAIRCVGQAGQILVEREVAQMGADALTLTADTQAGGHLDLRALEQLGALPEVESALPLSFHFCAIRMHGLEAQAMLWGAGSGESPLLSLALLHGRLLDEVQIRQGEMVCLVDEKTALAFYGRSNIVGKTVTIQAPEGPVQCRVVGVVQSGGALLQAFAGDQLPYFVYLPYTTLAQLKGEEEFTQAMVHLSAAAQQQPQAQQRILQALYRLQGGEEGAFSLQDFSQQKAALQRLVRTVSDALTVIAGVSVLVAAMGIMTVMLVSVHERTREIGIKKALGASRGRIVGEFLFQSGLLSGVGGALGLLAAWAGAAAVGQFGSLPVDFPLPMAAGGWALSLGLGVLCGAYPAFLAASLQPVQAIGRDF